MTKREIQAQIAQLPRMDRSARVKLWRDLFGREAAKGLRKEIMVPIMAYRIQEREYGGLKPETLAKLRKIAMAIEKNPKAKIVEEAHERVGTRLSRTWHGENYEVTVTAGGFHCNGTVYRSLSEIARAVTGTRWSGPAFFGLKQSRKTKEVANE